MDRKKFNELRDICRKSWVRLSKSNNLQKYDIPEIVRFFHECPACHISAAVRGRKEINCCLCPINRWREREGINKHDPHCQHGELYDQWRNGEGKERMKAAAKIAKLGWTYLPEYKKVKI